jgi:hypothetical protein
MSYDMKRDHVGRDRIGRVINFRAISKEQKHKHYDSDTDIQL